MKKRLGFVSNSSSSSFVVWGIQLDTCEDKLKEKCTEQLFKRLYDEQEEYIKEDLVEELYDWTEDDGLVANDDESGYIQIGLYAEKMKDDETLKQYKEKVLQKLIEKGIKAKYEDIHWIEEVSYC
jgi:hypothetical protein